MNMTREICYIDKEGNGVTCSGTVNLATSTPDDGSIDCSKCDFRHKFNGDEDTYFTYTNWTGDLNENLAKLSLYIPPGKLLSDVLNVLRDEYGTSSNIKSTSLRNKIQSRLLAIVKYLKYLKEIPPKGIAIFSGKNFIAYYPEEPIKIYLYRTDSRFHMEHLKVV